MEEQRAEELSKITTEIEEVVASTGEQKTESSSRGESPAYNKSIADMAEEQAQPSITMKELKALKRAGYDKIVDQFPMAYVLKNKKTGLVVQIQAASSYHACNIIGWRARHVQLLDVIDTKKKENTAEEKKEAVVENVSETK
jgi:hypothetical protein